jgi:hypothetical protein
MDNDRTALNEDAQPAAKPSDDIGVMKKVDTKVQEDAAKEREETGGYQ